MMVELLAISTSVLFMRHCGAVQSALGKYGTLWNFGDRVKVPVVRQAFPVAHDSLDPACPLKTRLSQPIVKMFFRPLPKSL